MADFSIKSTDMSTTIEPAAVVLQPVDRSNEIQALQSIGKGIAQGASVLGGFISQKKAGDTAKSLAGFSIQLNDLQDAFDQGTISSSEYGMRRRALLKQRLADTPALEEDLLKRYSTFREQNGLAAVEGPGVQAAKIRQDAVQGAVNNGFLSVDKVGNAEAEDAAIQNLGQFNTSVRQLKEQSDRIGLEKSKLELGSSQRAAKDAEAKDVVQNGLAKIGRDGLPYWRTQYENIKVRAAQATNEMERRQIISDGIMKMEQDFSQRAAAISGDTLGIEQGKVDQVLKPQQDLIAAYKKELSGEYDTETFNRYVDASQARAKALAMDGLDETTKQWIAVSEIAKSAPGAFNNQILTGVTNAFGKNAKASGATPDGKPYDVLPTGAEETKNVKNYLGVLTNTIEDWNKGKFNNKPAEEKALLEGEIADQMKSILKGVDVHSNATESAKEFQPIIDFFSNPSVGDYLRGKGLDPEAQSRVAQVIQDGYASQVVPMLRAELGESMFNRIRVGNEVMRYDQLVEPTMKSGRFGFQLKPEYQDNFAARSTLKALNESSFTKVMNKMIISDANIRGDGNYQKSYDETFGPAVFPAEQGDAGDDGVDTTQTGSVEGYVDPMIKSAASSDFQLDDIDDDEPWQLPAETEDISSTPSYASEENKDGRVFNSVMDAGKGYTTIKLPDGSVVRRSGARNWRNNNPGNIEYGSFAKAQGAIGSDGRFAVFPSYEAGRKAKAALLFEGKGYKDKTIAQAINRYAPPFENNTSAYVNAVARAIGVSANTPLSDLSSKQREVMLNAMERVEGFKPGREVAVNS